MLFSINSSMFTPFTAKITFTNCNFLKYTEQMISWLGKYSQYIYSFLLYTDLLSSFTVLINKALRDKVLPSLCFFHFLLSSLNNHCID